MSHSQVTLLCKCIPGSMMFTYLGGFLVGEKSGTYRLVLRVVPSFFFFPAFFTGNNSADGNWQTLFKGGGPSTLVVISGLDSVLVWTPLFCIFCNKMKQINVYHKYCGVLYLIGTVKSSAVIFSKQLLLSNNCRKKINFKNKYKKLNIKEQTLCL